MTDRVRGNCTPVPLQAGTFDTKKLGPAEVRIRTAKEFFDFDNVNGNGYTYEGVVSTSAGARVTELSEWCVTCYCPCQCIIL